LWLCSTVEDTGTKPEELKQVFGEQVAAIVMEVTDDKSLPKVHLVPACLLFTCCCSKDERKKQQIHHAAHCSQPAK
jgi:guanosine-3',5'-bis(diphosphate) 3'-pyrophosphohydrolase